MDVATQKNFEMTMKEWQKYYDDSHKDKLLNVISLEFSHTRLENYIRRPHIVSSFVVASRIRAQIAIVDLVFLKYFFHLLS